MSALKDRMIRDVENAINVNKAKQAQLEEELEGLYQDEQEARDMLHFLKTGNDRPVREARPPRSVEPEEESEQSGAYDPRGDRKPRSAPVSEDQYKAAMLTFGSREFTSIDIAEKTGASAKAASNMLNKLTDAGFLVRTAEHRLLGRGGTTPARYRLRRSA